MPFYRVLIAASCLAFGVISPESSFAGPRATLKKLTAEIQSSPDNRELREKIIKLALTLKPAPAVPKEARRRMAFGEAAFEAAAGVEDYAKAIEEFSKAALAAPWHAEAYHNLGVAQEKAGRLDDAMRSLQLYLLAAPAAKDAAEIEKKIFKLEYAAKAAGEKASQEAEAAGRQQRKEAFLDNLDGGEWFCEEGEYRKISLRVRGRVLFYVSANKLNGTTRSPDVATIAGPAFTVKEGSWCVEGGAAMCDGFGTISDDGDTIVYPRASSNATSTMNDTYHCRRVR